MTDLPDPSLPPGFHAENIRDIYIPRYLHEPWRPQNSDAHHVDVCWLLVIDDEHHLLQLRYVMAWYNTIGNFLWKSKIVLKAFTTKFKRQISESTGETRSTVLKEDYLPTLYDWVFWKGQVDWLDTIYNSLGKQVIALQSYNKGCVAELSHPT